MFCSQNVRFLLERGTSNVCSDSHWGTTATLAMIDTEVQCGGPGVGNKILENGG